MTNVPIPTPFLLCLMLTFSGCADSDEPITTDMHEDFTHDHQHRHGDNEDHEHEHGNDFEGSHSHGHVHGHRHGKPLHGGRISSIGHTHHKDGATHFHVEIMPLTDNTIRFFLQTENEEGEAIDCAITESEIVALLSVKGQESSGMEMTFAAVAEGESAEFALELPEDLAEQTAFSVVIPKIKLGGQRQNFSFKIEREVVKEIEAAENETDGESDSGE